MGFFAIVNAYTMRVSLSLAITEMVIPLNATEYYDPNACVPEGSNQTNSAIKVKNNSRLELLKLVFILGSKHFV